MIREKVKLIRLLKQYFGQKLDITVKDNKGKRPDQYTVKEEIELALMEGINESDSINHGEY